MKLRLSSGNEYILDLGNSGHICIGDQLEVMIDNQHCVSDVKDITNKGTLYITVPASQSKPVPLRIGEEINVNYFSMRGLLTFVANVVSFRRADTLRLIEIIFTGEMIKHQNREFVRYQTQLDILIRELALPEQVNALSPEEVLRSLNKKSDGIAKRNPDGNECIGITLDLSAGGIQFLSPLAFKKDTLVECSVWLKTGEIFKVDALSTFCVDLSEEEIFQYGTYFFKVRANFIGLRENARRVLTKYIMEQEINDRYTQPNE
ncbi:flagellar brake protein [Lachnospiraceae bacterium ZAX-1]